MQSQADYTNDINTFIGDAMSDDFVSLIASILVGWNISEDDYMDSAGDYILEARSEAQTAMAYSLDNRG